MPSGHVGSPSGLVTNCSATSIPVVGTETAHKAGLAISSWARSDVQEGIIWYTPYCVCSKRAL